MEFTIGELAGRCGVATHVLRHWEQVGLLSPARRVAARRVYTEADLTRVAEIQICKDAGFTLDEIRELFTAATLDARRSILRAQLARVRDRIARLSLSETMLEHGLRCAHDDHQACPRFQSMIMARLDGVPLAKALDHP
ncbi:MerR family transcriptional regulator [Actinoplanes lobatus]|uniref:DNA-binding transcriptional MerR regulator n=1 Tax=Actinoplanes lobatus TaxID=113568 RepID=A0A7W7HLD0_9ACTN|nr:MerR family transcriptional regulator [Actinoplanes lobatus]MBB4752639.1 DNA-binding transcriptional MerR regulator [Actinoplanes lobatus]GGN93701.1 MerR family transcriptional regulator [Actinoplanes lobatus]GIE44695.1 MerR family transcriptional regulator [Actinoplanes lobatus]